MSASRCFWGIWTAVLSATLVTAVLLFALRESEDGRQRPSEVFIKTQNSILKVYGLSANGAGSRAGTGFATLLPEGPAIVTNRHVVEGAEVVVVESEPSVWFSTEWREHPHLDIAILPIPEDQNVPLLSIDNSSPVGPGETVFTVGYPLGESLAIQQGIISTTDGLSLVFSAPLSTGASGSPLLNSRAAVVGLCHSFVPEAQNYNLALPASFISLPTEWNIKKSVVDQGLSQYLNKIVEVKKTIRKTHSEWRTVAEEFPEWEKWVRETEKTRRPLSNALESLVMAAHSVDWSTISLPSSAEANLLVTVLLEKNAKALEAAWVLHKSNLEASLKIQPSPYSWTMMADMSLVPEMVRASRILSKAISAEIVRSPPDASDSNPKNQESQGTLSHTKIDIERELLSTGSLPSALSSYLEMEERWSKGLIP